MEEEMKCWCVIQLSGGPFHKFIAEWLVKVCRLNEERVARAEVLDWGLGWLLDGMMERVKYM